MQGAPGTGKTAVGLHRVAYLLYTERERLSRGGVVIVGPNRSFLSYIRKVLPALGEVDVRQITIEELISEPATASDEPEPARVKGDGRMAGVLRACAVVLRRYARPKESCTARVPSVSGCTTTRSRRS